MGIAVELKVEYDAVEMWKRPEPKGAWEDSGQINGWTLRVPGL